MFVVLLLIILAIFVLNRKNVHNANGSMASVRLNIETYLDGKISLRTLL